jgi:hypothetical protein
MTESRTFNVYKENPDKKAYKEKKSQTKKLEAKNAADEPIPKPPPQYWNDPLSYRRFNRESEGTSNIL